MLWKERGREEGGERRREGTDCCALALRAELAVCQRCGGMTREKDGGDGKEQQGRSGKRRQMGGGDSTKVEAAKRRRLK